MTPAAPASHTSCPSSSAAAPLHRKTQSFALRFPPQPKSLATFMQPPAITMRFAAARAHSCSHYNAICIHALQNTKEEPITIETTPAAPAAHTSCPSHFTRKNTRFRALASSPTQVPCNMHAAITMRFATAHAHSCSHYTAICIYALQNTKERPLETTPAAHTSCPSSSAAATLHGKTPCFVLRLPPQHSRSHFNALRNTLSSPPFVTTSGSHHFPLSSLPLVITSLP